MESQWSCKYIAASTLDSNCRPALGRSAQCSPVQHLSKALAVGSVSPTSASCLSFSMGFKTRSHLPLSGKMETFINFPLRLIVLVGFEGALPGHARESF